MLEGGKVSINSPDFAKSYGISGSDLIEVQMLYMQTFGALSFTKLTERVDSLKNELKKLIEGSEDKLTFNVIRTYKNVKESILLALANTELMN